LFINFEILIDIFHQIIGIALFLLILVLIMIIHQQKVNVVCGFWHLFFIYLFFFYFLIF